jgi:hypothetical protein
MLKEINNVAIGVASLRGPHGQRHNELCRFELCGDKRKEEDDENRFGSPSFIF